MAVEEGAWCCVFGPAKRDAVSAVEMHQDVKSGEAAAIAG